jgi:hypothetical protein
MLNTKLREEHELVRVRHGKQVEQHKPTTTGYTQKPVARRDLRPLRNKPMQKPSNHDVANGGPNAVAHVAPNAHPPKTNATADTHIVEPELTSTGFSWYSRELEQVVIKTYQLTLSLYSGPNCCEGCGGLFIRCECGVCPTKGCRFFDWEGCACVD